MCTLMRRSCTSRRGELNVSTEFPNTLSRCQIENRMKYRKKNDARLEYGTFSQGESRCVFRLFEMFFFFFVEMKRAPEVCWCKWELFGIRKIKHWMYNRKFSRASNNQKRAETQFAHIICRNSRRFRIRSKDHFYSQFALNLNFNDRADAVAFDSNHAFIHIELWAHSIVCTRSPFLLLLSVVTFLSIAFNNTKFTGQAFPHHIRFLFMMR